MVGWRRIAQVSVLALLAGSLLVVVPSVVAPSSAPKAEAHGAYTNGCSGPRPFVVDWSASFNFHDECDQHDRCYTYHWYGGGASGRQACDVMFYNLMARDCARGWWWFYPDCIKTAEIYYRGVQIFGKPYFDSPDLTMRSNTRMA
jgi:hypothetical protein